MNVKQIRENMTEAALSVENVIPRITLQELSAACSISQPAVEFIIEQMLCMRVAQRRFWAVLPSWNTKMVVLKLCDHGRTERKG